MKTYDENFSIKWDAIKINLNGKSIDYPVLRVKISGDPSFNDFLTYIGKIESFTEDFEEDYISTTDFTDLSPNRAIESIISVSSNRLIRSVLFVSNQSKISFVVLGKDSKLSILKKRLEIANKKQREDDYSYNYRFIEEESQVKNIAENYLNKE